MRGETARRADYTLLGASALLLFFGLVMLTSASTPVGQERFHDAYFFIKHQLLYGVVPGTILFLIAAKLDFHLYKKAMWSIFGFLLFLLMLVFIPGIGSTLNTGARSWLVIGPASIQPAEIVKLGLILFFSAYLALLGDRIAHPTEGFLPALMFAMIPVGMVVLQPDVGTAAILFAIVVGLLFVAGARLQDLGFLTLLGVVALLILVIIAPYRAARLSIFLHPELDPAGKGYQINQAFLAIGSGGVTGLGLGHSRQKFQYLPEVHGDSIFAVVAEEMGFVVTTAFLALLVFIWYRGFQIARATTDPFGRLVAAGIVIWFMTQSGLNIGAMLGVLPLTGVPLPFVSHGGTALMIALAGLGILTNISKYARVS